ncbi:peptide-methionine (R)-S-oxide reductase MsrB [Lutimaribacter sp. EGI FJ00015]|uniref:Peptide-methionine (R)-S-oxide reductase MsrB n=1 Tax=Lutimaribacter degradans TaxID=2945989 RepID=A0ACC5ZQX4_9RHOB|nr:peptide-methionine (R)-S-oxide reductase MsrB [Lutimaribacter sp. EGI FJ00013]MCM2560723.1 peptide-methionine (R)-S-oxide reductase MsrB [Lutimaribacter sp. EGI FJ00013]MCO0612332.1 peptide-methionine (R)-S-oxide reductase MsrB [Lutimaribacter sp. EGI FJ00015]MCO0634548.1 peptide-methionine (R)-S-oxide reductase MsrB [Lutimaribacter sp. EGI FJ00014]
MNRRHFLALGSLLPFAGTARAAQDRFEVIRSDAEWREMLTPEQYNVMRREGTEPPGSSPLDKVYDPGMYHCRGCDLALYSSEHKYDSGTGWPSFWQAQEGAIGTKRDFKLIYPRTECHCGRCGSHLGHIFNDGPPPTGKRHCLNGVSLVFKRA